MPNQPTPCCESDGYANPHDSVDRLGRLYAALQIGDKYGISFELYVKLVQRGGWGDFIRCVA